MAATLWKSLPPIDEIGKRLERQMLRRFLPLFLHNFNRILWTPEHFFVQFHCAGLGTSISGFMPAPLGVLILMWRDGSLVFECPSCGGPYFVFGASGSPLSGAHFFKGICGRCRRWLELDGVSSFSSVCQLFTHFVRAYPNDPDAPTNDNDRWDPSHGLTGELPDIMAPAPRWGVRPVTIGRLYGDLTRSPEYRLPPDASRVVSAGPGSPAYEDRVVPIQSYLRWSFKSRLAAPDLPTANGLPARVAEFGELRRMKREKADVPLRMPPFPLRRECPGCGKPQTSTLVWREEYEGIRFMHSRVTPHHLCDGQRVIYQDPYDEES